MKSRMLKDEPSLVMPYTLSVDPSAMKLRKERVLPR
jgi:hypothetical protein